MRWTFNRAKVVAEPSGAASVAAVLSGKADAGQYIDGPVIAILSGGNIATDLIGQWLNR